MLTDGTRAIDRTAGSGRDGSVNAPVLLGAAPMAEFFVSQAGEYAIQNQSGAAVQVVFDDGEGAIGSLYLLGAGETIQPMVWFVGRVTIYGAAGAAIFARYR